LKVEHLTLIVDDYCTVTDGRGGVVAVGPDSGARTSYEREAKPIEWTYKGEIGS
jgi:hypothetical protein